MTGPSQHQLFTTSYCTITLSTLSNILKQPSPLTDKAACLYLIQTVTRQHQVETAGDSLRCPAVNASGEALALGGSGGYLHLWSSTLLKQQFKIFNTILRA
jgi:hypothetical protein